jgi:hypothetical protein
MLTKNNYCFLIINMDIDIEFIKQFLDGIEQILKHSVFPGSYIRHSRYDYYALLINHIVETELRKIGIRTIKIIE